MTDNREKEQAEVIASLAQESAKRHFDRANTYEASLGRTLFLANAGAIVALLTFVGNSSANVDVDALFWAFGCFGIGVGSVMMLQWTQFSRYENLAQFEEKEAVQIRFSNSLGTPIFSDVEKTSLEKSKLAFHLSLLLSSVGAVSFLAGAFTALDAIT